jgi:superfamily II DNA or RNA helicase
MGANAHEPKSLDQSFVSIGVHSWFYSPDHRQVCQVIETQVLWGETMCRVWVPGLDTVVRIPASRLKALDYAITGSPDGIAYIAAAGRVADALTQDVLLAPIESSVIPLPHQIRALSRAISHDRVRYLLADEVGLGKTIEAGLIMRELKLRGMVNRTLVIAPKGLVSQWVSEMRFHFGESFQLVLPDDIKTLRKIVPTATSVNRESRHHTPETLPANAWQIFSQVVVPMDSVKPLDKRRGWSPEQLSEHNRERFDDLISAGWDLVIVDEAHRFGGSTDQVARFKLGQGLSEAAPYLLLLSATPHQGKTDAFHRLVSLIDADAFPDITSVTRERVQPYVIRTEKRRAINAEGGPLFKPRRTQLATVSWSERHSDQHLLYDAVTEYVRDGYNQAKKEKRSYIGFLMILMQRLVVSSTSAIRTTLERRLEALSEPEEQLTLFPMADDDWLDMDGQEQVDVLLRTRIKALKNERAEVKLLLTAAARCEQTGPDVKAEALLDWLYRLQAEEGDPDLKALVFTEFVPTQEMLRRFLAERGFSVVCLNGSMDMDERKRVQDAFATDARVLISTDAGGEGLNLQFCHVVINYDIPWNPMRLEQRIGRVDRIGQTYPVRAINFVFDGSVEHRVREVLEEKLAVIFDEFGIDKTGDVLDSAQAGQIFDEMYVESILHPDMVESTVDSVIARLHEQAQASRMSASVLGSSGDLEPNEAQRLLTHPLPHWVERMTVSYLHAHGGHAERSGRAWDLTWPDGSTDLNVVFSAKDAERTPSARHLTLEDPRIRGLTMRVPRFAPCQPVPVICIPGMRTDARGVWSLWRISIATAELNRVRIVPLFVDDSGNVLLPTARHIWDQLVAADCSVPRALDPEASLLTYEVQHKAAEEHGKPIFDALAQEHSTHIARERDKFDYALAARRRAIDRIGLPQVRDHRLHLLQKEEQELRAQIELKAKLYPEMTPLLIVRVEVNDYE